MTSAILARSISWNFCLIFWYSFVFYLHWYFVEFRLRSKTFQIELVWLHLLWLWFDGKFFDPKEKDIKAVSIHYFFRISFSKTMIIAPIWFFASIWLLQLDNRQKNDTNLRQKCWITLFSPISRCKAQIGVIWHGKNYSKTSG